MHSLKRWRSNNRKLRAGSLAVLALTLGASATAWAQDPNAELNTRVALPYNQSAVEKLLSNARFLGHQSPDTPVKLVFTLPLRNEADLDTLLKRLYDHNDPLFRHYLTPQQFTEKFGPTEDDYNTVISYAQSAGLKVTGTTPSRTLLDVEGSTEAVETALGLRINRYLMPDGRVSYAAEGLPSVPKWLAERVTGIVGLNNLSARHHHHTVVDALTRAVKPLTPHVGSGPVGGYSPSDIKSGYNLNTTLKGDGESVAVYELDGYSQADISTYTQFFGLGTPHLQNVFTDGYDGSLQDPTFGGEVEVELDIDMVLALAPNVSNLYVYGAANASPDALDQWQRIANDNLASVISTSWGQSEDLLASGEADTENKIFKQMASQGQAIFDASGDDGAFDNPNKSTTLEVDDPAGQPFVTGVGGTTLSINSLGAFSSEAAWSGSGGGVSSIWPKPTYQTGVSGSSSTNREVPDVSLNANPSTGYDIFVNNANGWITVGGTSSAAPLWTAFAALVNEQLVKYGSPRIGFMNPTLYSIATSSALYGQDFHDVTTGKNGTGGFSAKTGFDDVTGWGSFNGIPLLNQLAPPQSSVTGTVTGTVLDENGVPITVTPTGGTAQGAVTVKATDTSNGVVAATTTTDTSGNYTLTLHSGVSYTISADAPNYAGASVSGVMIPVTNGTGGTKTENFTLVPGHVYQPGLQMISAPYEFTGLADFATLFGTVSDPPVGFPNGSDPLLYIWQPNLNQYAQTPSYPADTIHLGAGYWTNLKTSDYLHRQGTPAPDQNFRIVLLKGWNMIGDPFVGVVPVSSLQVDTLSASGAVPISQSTTVALPFFTYGPTSTDYTKVTSTDSLQPFAGYWVYTTADCVLVVPPSITPPGPPPV